MKKLIYTILTAFTLITVLYHPGIAGGIGLYGSWSNGKNFIKKKVSPVDLEVSDYDRGFMSYGGGFVADTNLGKESIFNYRFKFGYDYEEFDAKKSFSMNRLMLSNTFGFGLYRDDMVRLWFGPQIGIGYYWGVNNFTDWESRDSNKYPLLYKKFNLNMLNVYVGLVLGLNMNITEHFSLAFEGGMRFNIYHDFDKGNYGLGGSDNRKRFENTFPVMGPEGYLSLGVMFRFKEAQKNTNENYQQDIKIEKVK